MLSLFFRFLIIYFYSGIADRFQLYIDLWLIDTIGIALIYGSNIYLTHLYILLKIKTMFNNNVEVTNTANSRRS